MHADNARGALLGMAMGDALGLPAEYHRHARAGWGRSVLWEKNTVLDEQRISRPMLPFGLSGGSGGSGGLLSGTDDVETAATTALVLLESRDHGTNTLFEGWRKHYVETDDVWCGIAERGAVRHALRGERPPVTGSDNPVYWDDGAVASAVPIGVLYAGDPASAARVAQDYARITHSRDGVWAARAMAHAVAALIGGEFLEPALQEAELTVPADSWLRRGLERAAEAAEGADTAFEAIPALVESFGRPVYSHGGVAPETLPLAFTLTRLVRGDLAAGLQAAALLPRQSDSLPAMVGALCGAIDGEKAVPADWAAQVDPVSGVLLPGVAGQRLTSLADRLLEARERFALA